MSGTIPARSPPRAPPPIQPAAPVVTGITPQVETAPPAVPQADRTGGTLPPPDPQTRTDAQTRAARDPVAAQLQAQVTGSQAALGDHIHASANATTRLTAADVPALRNQQVLTAMGVPSSQQTPPTDRQRRAFFTHTVEPAAARDAISQHRFGEAAGLMRARATTEAAGPEPTGAPAEATAAARRGSFYEASQLYLTASRTAPAEQQPALLARGEAMERAAFYSQSATQLDMTQRMETALAPRHADFPPTMAQAQQYFHTMEHQPAARVATEYRDYTSAFYQHVQSREAGGTRDAGVSYGGVGGTATRSSHITDDAQLSSTGRRILDCDGYSYMAEQLLGSRGAGFHQPDGGGYMSVGQASGARSGHSMLLLERGSGTPPERVFISNDRAMAYPSSGDAHEQFRSSVRGALVDSGTGTARVVAHQGSTAYEARHSRELAQAGESAGHPWPRGWPLPWV